MAVGMARLLSLLVQNEVSFSSFSKFKKDYYQYYVAMCRQLAKDGKVPAEHKETLKDNLKSALAFIEANFSSIQVTVVLASLPPSLTPCAWLARNVFCWTLSCDMIHGVGQGPGRGVA